MDVNIHCSVQPNHCSSVGFYWSVQWQTAGFINCGPLWIHRRMKHDKAVLMFLQRWVVSTCPSLEGITQRVLAFILRCDWGDYICFHQLTFDCEATNPRGKFDYIFDTKCFFFFFCKCWLLLLLLPEFTGGTNRCFKTSHFYNTLLF